MPDQPSPRPSKKQAEDERETIRKALDETEAPTAAEIERQRQQAGARGAAAAGPPPRAR